MALQDEVDSFIAQTGQMTQAAVAFLGEEPTEIAAANIRRLRGACVALLSALDQASAWAMSRPSPGPAAPGI